MNFDLKRVATVIDVQPRRHKLKTGEYQTAGAYPIIDQGAGTIAGFTDDFERLYDGPLPIIVFGDHTCCLKYVKTQFAVGADGTQLIRPIAGIDTRFLYYALHTADLEQFGYQRHFKLLKDCDIPIPPLSLQIRIASILGAYDDLIEVNRRRVTVLEEMARGLFEDWFVRFRFPGHETVPILDTPDGPLPDGWRSASLGEFGQVITGKTPSKAQPEFFGTDLPFVKIPDMHGSTFILQSSEMLSFQGAASQANKTVPEGTLCVSCIATIGLVSITTAPCQTNQQINSLVPSKPEWIEYLFFSLLALKPHLKNLGSNGATMGNVNKQKLSGILLKHPTSDLLSAYHKLSEPMLSLIRSVSEANHRLAASRDRLLPRLISGQLSLASAERELEAVA